MQMLVVTDGIRKSKLALYYLRTNGLKRFLYLACLRTLFPLLEPLRRLVVSFLMLPGRRKGQVLIPIAVVCLVLAALTSLWHAVPLFILLVLCFSYKYVYAKLRPVLRARYWRTHKHELLEAGEQGYVLTVEHLGLQEEGFKALQKELEETPEVVIADIDQDGFLLSRFGPIPDAPSVGQEGFLKRKRRPLRVVAMGNKVGVKKSYHGNKARFLNELEALNSLAGRCNVPAILDVDFNNLTITLSYIPGPVIREELARRGAMLRNRDLDGHPDFMHLSPKERNLKRIEQGRRVLHESVDQELVDDIFTELKRIHKTGICIGDMKYGNIIIERDSGNPYFIDFEHSRNHGRPRGLQWQVRRDHEIERFNLQFNTEKLMRDSMLRKIGELLSEGSSDWHNPVDFGYGVAVGRTWDVESGEGRWHYILKRNFPPLSGKRVLDLGCSDGYFSLQMLRHGAREVVGSEGGDLWIKRAHFVKEGFEWADSTTYNLKVLHARMEKVPTIDLGGFDLVTALYGLHHMDDELIDKLIRHVGTLTNCFIVQCNLDPKEHSPEVRLRASVDYNIKALERNGFHISRVVAPPGYKRPLLIGTKA